MWIYPISVNLEINLCKKIQTESQRSKKNQYKDKLNAISPTIKSFVFAKKLNEMKSQHFCNWLKDSELIWYGVCGKRDIVNRGLIQT